MRLKLFLVTVILSLFLLSKTQAQVPPGAPAATVTTTTVTEQPVDPLEELKLLRADYARLNAARAPGHDKHELWMACAGFIATIGKVIISAMVRYKDMAGHQKDRIPEYCLYIGIVVAILTKYSTGTDWVNALMVGWALPGSVFLNEFMTKNKMATSIASALAPAKSESQPSQAKAA